MSRASEEETRETSISRGRAQLCVIGLTNGLQNAARKKERQSALVAVLSVIYVTRPDDISTVIVIDRISVKASLCFNLTLRLSG
jgi:hypothetical protein